MPDISSHLWPQQHCQHTLLLSMFLLHVALCLFCPITRVEPLPWLHWILRLPGSGRWLDHSPESQFYVQVPLVTTVRALMLRGWVPFALFWTFISYRLLKRSLFSSQLSAGDVANHCPKRIESNWRGLRLLPHHTSLMWHLSLTRTSQNPRLAPLCTWYFHLFYLIYFSSCLHPCQFLIHGSRQETNLVLFFPLSMDLCLILPVSSAATVPPTFTLRNAFSRALCTNSCTSHPIPFCPGITQVMDRPCQAIRLLEISML